MTDAQLLERSAFLAENPAEIVPWSYTDDELEHLAGSAAMPAAAQDRHGDENVPHPRAFKLRTALLRRPRLDHLAGAAPNEGQQLATYTFAIINGRPYAADGGRFGTFPHGLPGEHFDCSGSQTRGLNDLGHGGVPTVSATQARWCRDNGLDGLSVARASATPGAALFVGANHGYDGFGNDGHVVGCLGNGWTYEARGRAYGCGSWPIAGRRWDNAGLWPGVNYLAPVVPPPPEQHSTDDEDDDMSDTLTRWTANNLPSEWHVGHIAGGNLWHRWGPRNDANRELLCGPQGAKFGRPVTPPLVAVTAQKGVAGDGGRIDLYAEDEAGAVYHLWRSRNDQPWSFELVP